MHIFNFKSNEPFQDPALADTDRASVLTAASASSDSPAWYRDGSDETLQDQDDGDNISIIERALEPNGESCEALGKASVGEPIETEFDDDEVVDDEKGGNEDESYMPDSPRSTTSTLFDFTLHDQAAPGQKQIDNLKDYTKDKPEPKKQQSEHDVYRQRFQRWIMENRCQSGYRARRREDMCTVCNLRPKCVRGGVKYPTCGLTCASRLLQAPLSSADMCNYCRKRPKAVNNGRVFPQCGNACRRRAEQFGVVDPLDWESAQPILVKGLRPLNKPSLLPKSSKSALNNASKPPLKTSDTPSAPPSSKLCVVCQRNPPYDDGLRSFPTCGRRCGEILRSRIPSGGRSRSHSQPPRPDYNYHYQTTPPAYKPGFAPTMCTVCHTRPQYRKNGTVYPTCGFTCSAQLTGSEAYLCSYCKERPKAVRHKNGKLFPQCGKTCRDRAWVASWSNSYQKKGV